MTSATLSVSQVLKRAHKALKANPQDATLHSMVAPLYEQLGRYDEAVPHLAFMLSQYARPDESLYTRYVKALQRAGAYSRAHSVIDEGLRHHPSSVALLRQRAMTFMMMSDFQRVHETYAALGARDPSDRHSVAMAGYIRLLLSELQEGYDEYALRPLDESLEKLFAPVSRWNGEPLAGRRIVLTAEQGIGDVIMFLGLFSWLVAQGPSVSMVITQKLSPLVARSFPQVEIITEAGVSRMDVSSFAYRVPMGDLLRSALPHHTPSENPPYLLADAERATHLRAAYRDYAQVRGRTKLVGVSWHTTNPEVGFTRNVTLQDLRPLFGLPNVQFVSLQYGDHAEDIEACSRSLRDILLQDKTVDAFNDLDGLASQMAAMDHVVTIDNATVHMAGALGVPTTLLLSTMPDWRWGLKRSDCRWYRSVHSERQDVLGKWQPVIKRVCATLNATDVREP